MVTNIAMTTRGVNVLFHSVSPVVSHLASVHGGGPHLTDHGARRTEPSSIHGGRAVHGGAGRPLEMSTPSSGPGGRPRGSGPSYSPWASWSRQAGPSTGERVVLFYPRCAPPYPGAVHGGAGRPAPVEPGQDLLGRYGGRGPEKPAPRPLARSLASSSARTPAAHPGGSRRCRPTRPWRAPAARHTPGRVELTMSPQLTLCELSSRELSSGGFCQAELTSCEPEWILLSRPGFVRARLNTLRRRVF